MVMRCLLLPKGEASPHITPWSACQQAGYGENAATVVQKSAQSVQRQVGFGGLRHQEVQTRHHREVQHSLAGGVNK